MTDASSASQPFDQNSSFKDAALYWFRYGLKVIPIVPETKIPMLKWDPWLENLCVEKISEYWSKNPKHQLGFIVTDEFLVLDADTEVSLKALWTLEEEYGCPPLLRVKTTNGEHHYFRRAKDTVAVQNNHSTEKYPERLDVKTGRSLVVLPPSTGKEVVAFYASSANDLSEADQDFLNAIYKHNGKDISRLKESSTQTPISIKKADSGDVPPRDYSVISKEKTLDRIRLLLENLSPNCGYDDWLKALMAVFYESEGDEEGFKIANDWSSKGKKYQGSKEIQTKWQSFDLNSPTHYDLNTLMDMVDQSGLDALTILDSLEPQFEICEYIIINPDAQLTDLKSRNIFDQFDHHESEYDNLVFDNTPVLGRIANKGELTVLYASPNVGKTLITLKLLIEGIEEGRLDPSTVYYLNMDDSGAALQEKRRIAKKSGFKLFTERAGGFQSEKFHDYLKDFIQIGQASDMIIILDTINFFVDLMAKKEVKEFMKPLREFSIAGGTVIIMAHTNKNVGVDGNPVPGGTSDLKDSVDCAYVIKPVTNSQDKRDKFVEFINLKSRINTIKKVTYKYNNESDTSYLDRLSSVKKVEEEGVRPTKHDDGIGKETEMVTAVETCIKEGITSKMDLIKEVRERRGVSKNKATQFIEKYTGDDAERHKWNFEVVEHGKQAFYLLEQSDEKEK